MRRLLLFSCLALLAVPASALAAPAKISPKATTVSAAGVATVEVANPNRYVLRGKATAAVGGRIVASRTVRLAKRSVTEIKLRFNARALEALRAAGGRTTVTLKLRRAGSKNTTTARRALKLAASAAAPQNTAPAPQAAPAPAPAAPASTRWTARMGTEGAYDDFEFTLENGQMTITRPAMVPVSCGEMGGGNRIALSLELFDAAGPWTIGTDSALDKQSIAVNTLANPGAKTITYKVSETSHSAGKVAGKLSIFFSDSKLDILNGYQMIFINCAGTQSFEAIPAP